MLGFIGLAIGLLGVRFAQQAARPGRRSFLALLLTWTGAGLILTYYGADVYGPRVIGQYALNANDPVCSTSRTRCGSGQGWCCSARGWCCSVPAAVLRAAAGPHGAWRAARGRLPVARHGPVGPPRR
jgi:hypothetical protein